MIHDNKMNNKQYKIIVVSLSLVLIVLCLYAGYNYYQYNKKINLNGVEISQRNYDTIQKAFGDENLAYLICNIKDKKCVQIINRENYNKFVEALKRD